MKGTHDEMQHALRPDTVTFTMTHYTLRTGYKQGLEAWFFKLQTKQCDKFPTDKELVALSKTGSGHEEAEGASQYSLCSSFILM